MPLVWKRLLDQRKDSILNSIQEAIEEALGPGTADAKTAPTGQTTSPAAAAAAELSGGGVDRVSASPASKAPRVYVSDIQLVVNHPTAARQQWSCDNAKGGVTVLIPLTSHKPEEHGEQIFLPGSHRRGIGHFVYMLRRSLLYGGATEWVPNPGDVIVCDGPLMKRHKANESFHLCEAMLVVRFDFTDQKPPGQNPITAGFFNFLAGTVDLAGKIYQALPDNAPRNPTHQEFLKPDSHQQ
jgi:hypothetical protein